MEKLFSHDLCSRIMIHPHGAVLPIRMGIVEILAEFSKAVCLFSRVLAETGYIVLFI